MGMSTGLLIGVIVVIVLIVLLAGLYAAGVFTPASSSSSSSGGGGSGETYSAAAAAAAPAASSVPGGPWTAAGGDAVQLGTSVAINSTLLNESFDFGCGGHLLSGASSLTSFPATTSSPSSGKSTLWVIIFTNASGEALEVAVINGVATPVFTLVSFQSCSVGGKIASLPTGVVDSPTAAAVAWSAGGPAYAANHSSFDTEYILVPIEIGSTTTSYAYWIVTYTNCDPNEDGATLDGQAPAQFVTEVNATTGSLAFKESTSQACPVLKGSGAGGGSKPSLSSSCYLQFSEESSPPTYWNNGSLICTIKALTGADVTVSIENNTTGAAVSTSGFTLDILNETTLGVVSTYNFTTNTWSSPAVDVENLYSFLYWVLSTPTTMAGNKMVVTATASAPATGSVSGVLGGS